MIKKIIVGIIILIVIGVGYYGISPLFRNNYIDEAAPTQVKEMPSSTSTMMANGTGSTSAKSEKMKKETPVSMSTPVIDNLAHPGSGTVRIINTNEGTIVRYENFKTINGPDLYVYLANDLDAKDFVSLGVLKATEGNVNYSVPVGVDVNEYRYVMVWCKQFGVLFNYADLSLVR